MPAARPPPSFELEDAGVAGSSFAARRQSGSGGKEGRTEGPCRNSSTARVAAVVAAGLVLTAVAFLIVAWGRSEGAAAPSARSPWSPAVDNRGETAAEDNVTFVQRRGPGCNVTVSGIPKVLRVVVEYCDSAKQSVILGNIELADMSCFEIVCYPAAYREAYVKNNLPEWADFYVNLPLPIMKADVFRIMVLYLEGGFYMDDDVDVFPAFPQRFEELSARPLIVGWERRTPEKAYGTWCSDYGGMLCNSMATWAIGAQPKHEPLKHVIESTKAYFDGPRAGGAQDVLRGTGPTRFTNTILEHVSPDQVLGIEAFGCGQSHSSSPYCDRDDQRIWLKHRFEGKWRDQVGPGLFAQLRGTPRLAPLGNGSRTDRLAV